MIKNKCWEDDERVNDEETIGNGEWWYNYARYSRKLCLAKTGEKEWRDGERKTEDEKTLYNFSIMMIYIQENGPLLMHFRSLQI